MIRASEAALGMPCAMATFVDDRTFVARSAEQAMRVINKWIRWSSTLGLRENLTKLSVVAAGSIVEDAMRDQGASSNWFQQSIRVLGLDFTYAHSVAVTPSMQCRLNDAKDRLRRVQHAPVSNKQKAVLISMLVVPKATWGCWWQAPKDMFHGLQMQINKVLGVYKSHGSPDLLKLLRGHALQVDAKAAMDAVSNMHMVVSTQYCPPWSDRQCAGTWLRRVSGCLSSWGWRTEGPFRWKHDSCGLMDMRVAGQTAKHMHSVRESWRRSCFSAWTRFSFPVFGQITHAR
eukprot:s303_g28.t1